MTSRDPLMRNSILIDRTRRVVLLPWQPVTQAQVWKIIEYVFRRSDTLHSSRGQLARVDDHSGLLAQKAGPIGHKVFHCLVNPADRSACPNTGESGTEGQHRGKLIQPV